MFLSELGANDERFKGAQFSDGLNLILSAKTDEAGPGESRNSTGKSSFVWILRYLLGGNIPTDVKTETLQEHVFRAKLTFSTTEGPRELQVKRPVSPQTKLLVENGPNGSGWEETHIDQWRSFVASALFRIPSELSRPTPGQIWGQFIRNSFKTPTKGHQSDSEWETGIKLGYIFGLAPEVLNKASDVDKLDKQKKALKKVIDTEAVPHLTGDEASIRASLAGERAARDELAAQLDNYKVDEQYSSHQETANRASQEIRALNREALVLERRRSDLQRTLDESPQSSTQQTAAKVTRLYEELGVVFPDGVHKRFEEVAAFHESVIGNRRSFLEESILEADRRLDEITAARSTLGAERASAMRLLEEGVALGTFMIAQQEWAKKDALVADLERKLEGAKALGSIESDLGVAKASAAASLRNEYERESERLEKSMALFGSLGSEIYSVRKAQLLISPTPKGTLKFEPHISGDAGDGVKGVETFVLDLVSMIAGLELGRAPRILVHDSHLFNGVDNRQIASCLNIGARLAIENDFQYIVTMNSDVLRSVEEEGAFDREDYLVDLPLTDDSDEGGLFGFQFG